MHSSLILTANDDITKDEEIITVNGRDYFDILISPEISGMYEMLVKPDSKYRTLIDNGLFVPLMHYDSNERRWYYRGNVIMVKDYDIIGWRLVHR